MNLLTSLVILLALPAPDETIPFEFRDGRMTVQATVNGKSAHTFTLNTGRAGTILNRSLGKVVSLRFGKSEIRDFPYQSERMEADGVIGTDLLRRLVDSIDLKNRTLRLRERSGGRAHVGITYATIGDDFANEVGVEGGVIVKYVAPGSPAAEGGLRKDDIIQEINGKRMDTAGDYKKRLASFRPGQEIVFSVIRDKKDVDVNVTLGRRD